MGLRVLATILEDCPDHFLRRLLIKLPRDLGKNFYPIKNVPEKDKERTFILIKKIIKKEASECLPLLK